MIARVGAAGVLAGSLFAFLLLPAVTGAQDAGAVNDPAFEAARGAFFALSVADLTASSQWYAEKIGMKVVMHVPDGGGGATTVLEGGGLMVELVQRDDAVPLSAAAPGVRGALFVHGIFKVGLTVEDLDRAVATLRERGVGIALGPFPARDDQPANVLIRDNAGNYIQLFGK